jgi:S1-C subfamily serine protease
VLVTDVVPGNPAEKAGIKAYKAGVQQGDLILEVNRQSVSSAGELTQLLAKHKGGDGVLLLVQRSNAGMMVLKMA